MRDLWLDVNTFLNGLARLRGDGMKTICHARLDRASMPTEGMDTRLRG